MAEISTSRLKELLQRTVGPTPWYWKTFPAFNSASGQRFVWTHYGDQGLLAYLVSLSLEQEPEKPRLALNTYCRPFFAPPNRIWGFGALRAGAFASSVSIPINSGLLTSRKLPAGSSSPVNAYTPRRSRSPILKSRSAFRRPCTRSRCRLNCAGVDELIIPTSYPAKNSDDPAFALYVVYLQAGLVEVLPQKWFTASQYQVGKQWITRAARDPESHRIFGECFGTGRFLLEEDGCRLERWLEKTGSKIGIRFLIPQILTQLIRAVSREESVALQELGSLHHQLRDIHTVKTVFGSDVCGCDRAVIP